MVQRALKIGGCIVALLLVGAIVNVAAAWMISQRARPIFYDRIRVPDQRNLSTKAGESWTVDYLPEAGMAYIRAVRVSWQNKQFSDHDLPRWSYVVRASQAPASASSPTWTYAEEFARGWPMLSMHFHIEVDTTIYKFRAVDAINAPC